MRATRRRAFALALVISALAGCESSESRLSRLEEDVAVRALRVGDLKKRLAHAPKGSDSAWRAATRDSLAAARRELDSARTVRRRLLANQ